MRPELLTMLPVLALTLVALDHFPRRVRRGVYFGVTTGSEFASSDEGRALASKYSRWVWLGALCAVLVLFAAYQFEMPALFAAAIVAPMPFVVAGWVKAWHAASAHAIQPKSAGTAAVADQGSEFPVGLVLLALALLILAGSGLYLWSRWEQIPERFAIHYGADGAPNGFADKRFGTVFGPLLIGVGTTLMMLFFVFATAFGTRRGGSPEVLAYRKRMGHMLGIALGAVALVISLLFAWIALFPIMNPAGASMPVWAPLIAVLAIIAAVVWPLMKMNEAPGGPGDGTPDDCWKWGMIYYNPNDPALLVEKRTGLGYTFNFANKLSWVFFVVLVIAIAAPVLLMKS
jgi:uncharacterized membrane protein